jgi:hypothetical protein
VRRTVDYILDGDIFQANITQTFAAPEPQGFDSFALYAKLREKNPATFASLLDYDGIRVISSSPERLVRLDGRTAEARPIKGTRPRDADPLRDRGLAMELQASRKDRAENVMIVDLLRNDLSRVSQPGTVKVPVLCGLESYANVHHLVSVVQGELRPEKTVTDLARCRLPRRLDHRRAEDQGHGSDLPNWKRRRAGSIADRSAISASMAAATSTSPSAPCRWRAAWCACRVAAASPRARRHQAEYEESLTKIARLRAALGEGAGGTGP